MKLLNKLGQLVVMVYFVTSEKRTISLLLVTKDLAIFPTYNYSMQDRGSTV